MKTYIVTWNEDMAVEAESPEQAVTLAKQAKDIMVVCSRYRISTIYHDSTSVSAIRRKEGSL